MYDCELSSEINFNNLLVEPMKLAHINRESVRSGCAINLAPGFSVNNFIIFSSLKCSCTTQEPSHNNIFLPVFFMRYLPRFLSGEKRIGLSFGIWLIIFSALLDVQIISLNALTSAVQFI